MLHVRSQGKLGVAEELIIRARDGRVGRVTLNRPKVLNALNDELMDLLGAALLDFDADAEIGAIVIAGSPHVFAAGADVLAMSDWTYSDVYNANFITRNWEAIRQVRKPVIASVAGLAMGGGCELALACDVIVAARSAKFALPEIKLGLLPGAGGTQRLPRVIGKAKAMDMCLSARELSADEADRYGLVSRVVEDQSLESETLKLAARIARYSLPALIALKECVNRAYEASLAEGILFERRQLYGRFASADAHEGMKAFLEKREPSFGHR